VLSCEHRLSVGLEDLLRLEAHFHKSIFLRLPLLCILCAFAMPVISAAMKRANSPSAPPIRTTNHEHQSPQILGSQVRLETIAGTLSETLGGISDLEPTVIENVLRYLDQNEPTDSCYKRDLMTCRLVSKAIGFEATRLLFEKIWIRTNGQSLRQASSIQQTPSLASKVRAIIYHCHVGDYREAFQLIALLRPS
jgi:hypothetical protein